MVSILTEAPPIPDLAIDTTELLSAVARYCFGFGARGDVIEADILRRHRPYHLTALEHERLLTAIAERRDADLLSRLRIWGLDRIDLNREGQARVLARAMLLQEHRTSDLVTILNELRSSWHFSRSSMEPFTRSLAVQFALRAGNAELLRILREKWKVETQTLFDTGLNVAAYIAVHNSLGLFTELCAFWGVTSEILSADAHLGYRVAISCGAKEIETIFKPMWRATGGEPPGVAASDFKNDPWLARAVGVASQPPSSPKPKRHHRTRDPSRLWR